MRACSALSSVKTAAVVDGDNRQYRLLAGRFSLRELFAGVGGLRTPGFGDDSDRAGP